MPLYLRRDSIRMLEASLDALDLALSQLGSTGRHKVREDGSLNAPEIGLIGSAAELGMTACLVHAFGPSVQERESGGGYKTFSQILDEFRGLVREARPNSDFLVEGVDNAESHREDLINACSDFRILSTARAGGLHAGRGPTREAAIVQGNDVAAFLECLSKSSKISPYLKNIPECPILDKERTVIVEDLARRLDEPSGADEETLISSVFLVLPDVPEDKPGWIDALERVSVAPKKNDVNYLLQVLGEAVPATLRRTTRSGSAVPVTVDQDDPEALPIAIRYLKRQFSEKRDQLHADIATANGRLEDGSVDLPPVEAVREVFVVGIEKAGLVEGQDEMTAHESWPLIAASLDLQGTLGPYWYLIRATDDLGQLESQLHRAIDAGGRRLERNSEECLYGIDLVRSGEKISMQDDYFGGVIDDICDAEEAKSNIDENYERHLGTEKGLPDEWKSQLRDVMVGAPAGPLINSILDQFETDERKRYWTRVLCEASIDVDDLPALLRVLNSEEVDLAHTAARKAMRRIDFRLNGPPTESASTAQ